MMSFVLLANSIHLRHFAIKVLVCPAYYSPGFYSIFEISRTTALWFFLNIYALRPRLWSPRFSLCIQSFDLVSAPPFSLLLRFFFSLLIYAVNELCCQSLRSLFGAPPMISCRSSFFFLPLEFFLNSIPATFLPPLLISLLTDKPSL